MPDHKNQHFVPRCYFRPFSLNEKGRAINLYNISGYKAARNAPVKGQCARTYFYGDDLKLERLLQEYESDYAHILERIRGGLERPKEQDLIVLREFMMLQYSHTEAAINRTAFMFQDTNNTILDSFSVPPPDVDLSSRAMMLTTLQMYTGIRKTITDLKACLVKNDTSIDFVTSDDPEVLTSKFHAQKIKSNVFGTTSSGAMFYFPLSPRLLLLCYDGDVYTVNGKTQFFVSVTKNRDVYSCNELQYLNASQNIYFSRWKQKGQIESEFKAIESRRQGSRHRILKFVEDEPTTDGQRYRRVGKRDAVSDNKMLIGISPVHVFPTVWISKLLFRSRMKFRCDGSLAGYVRESEWRKRYSSV